MMFLSKNWYFSVQKVLIYYTVNKSHHNSFILLVFSHVANFRYVANFRLLTLYTEDAPILITKSHLLIVMALLVHYGKAHTQEACSKDSLFFSYLFKKS